MTEELSGKSDELIRYQEEISSLLSQIVDLQHKLKEVDSFTVVCPEANKGDLGKQIDTRSMLHCPCFI